MNSDQNARPRHSTRLGLADVSKDRNKWPKPWLFAVYVH